MGQMSRVMVMMGVCGRFSYWLFAEDHCCVTPLRQICMASSPMQALFSALGCQACHRSMTPFLRLRLTDASSSLISPIFHCRFWGFAAICQLPTAKPHNFYTSLKVFFLPTKKMTCMFYKFLLNMLEESRWWTHRAVTSVLYWFLYIISKCHSG